MCKFNPKNDSRRIDPCMKSAVWVLSKRYKVNIVACCCGHGKYPMSIIIKDKLGVYELFSEEEIPRKKKFYKKDRQGYYFVPEAVKYWKNNDNILYNQS